MKSKSEDVSFRFVTEEEIAADLVAAQKPFSYETQLGYPLEMLTDRQFECLLQDIYREEIRQARVDGLFDNVLLMQGVGERGRDCVLLLSGAHVGVIQCKRYSADVNKPDAAREIIKFVLHAIIDPDLLPNPAQFYYVFAASKGFNEKAKESLLDVSNKIGASPDLENWTDEVIQNYKAFKSVKYGDVSKRLIEILSNIKVKPLEFNDINTMLVRHSELVSKYFFSENCRF